MNNQFLHLKDKSYLQKRMENHFKKEIYVVPNRFKLYENDELYEVKLAAVHKDKLKLRDIALRDDISKTFYTLSIYFESLKLAPDNVILQQSIDIACPICEYTVDKMIEGMEDELRKFYKSNQNSEVYLVSGPTRSKVQAKEGWHKEQKKETRQTVDTTAQGR